MGTDKAVALGVVGGMVAVFFVLLVAVWVLLIIARWKVFTKAGEKGWKSIIPIYADYVQWRIGWKKIGLFWIMLLLVFGGAVIGYASGAITTNPYGNMVYTGGGGFVGVLGILCILAGAVLELMSVYKLFVSFGHGFGWLIGYIFVSPIMLLVLGFGSSAYLGPQD